MPALISLPRVRDRFYWIVRWPFSSCVLSAKWLPHRLSLKWTLLRQSTLPPYSSENNVKHGVQVERQNLSRAQSFQLQKLIPWMHEAELPLPQGAEVFCPFLNHCVSTTPQRILRTPGLLIIQQLTESKPKEPVSLGSPGQPLWWCEIGVCKHQEITGLRKCVA